MLLASSVCGLFKWRQFEPELILLAVGWYLRFSLSYRDVEELLAERCLHADHVTVWRWVQSYAPEMERRLRSELKPTNDRWRVDSDLHTGQGQVVLSIPRRGLDWGDDRLLALGQAGRGCCGALPE
jgi:transposase-like protein